ncbi:hypothetical protein [Psychromonas sp. SA13A]|uniref:hypothetical protein n=1 Tax=Psychromonas sp. SA13A TaxID=2686346 RepID=UPI00140B87D0|nr:hypothetical protein [Psychromonas sp. SA13A]
MVFDQYIGKILSFPNMDHFSAVEIRTAYLVLKNDEDTDKSDARRFVYSELLKLVNLGWLKKLVSTKKGITSYVKTDLFDVELLNIQTKYVAVDKAESVNTKNANTVSDDLSNRLNGYKSDLLEGLGEAEEYKNLRNEFPKMHDSLLEKYNVVRERNARLLGKIKAIEILIKQQK